MGRGPAVDGGAWQASPGAECRMPGVPASSMTGQGALQAVVAAAGRLTRLAAWDVVAGLNRGRECENASGSCLCR